MPRATNNSAASNASSSSSPLGPFPKTSTAPSTSSTNPLIPQLPLSAAALSSSSFAAPFTSASTSSSSAASSSSSPLAPTLPPLPPQDDAAEKAAFAELQAEEKAEGTGRMWDRAETERLHKEFQTYWDTTKKAPTYEWAKVHLAEEKEARKHKEPKGDKPMATRMWTQKDTERLHQMFKQEWDKTGKGPKAKWHAYTALLFKRSKRAIQGKWYEWAKVAGIGLRAWPKMDADGKSSGGMLSDSSDDSEGDYPALPADDDGTGAAAADGVEKKEGGEQTGERKDGGTGMTDDATAPFTAIKTDGEKQTERQLRKRRREERQKSTSSANIASSSTLDSLRLSPSDFQHILELRVGGINFGTLLVSSGDQPAAVQLVYKEGQTVTWNNPAFPLPPPPVSSSSNAASSSASSSASPPAAGSSVSKTESA